MAKLSSTQIYGNLNTSSEIYAQTDKKVYHEGNKPTSADISDATNTNTANKVVKRDGSGNFSAGTITAALSGNAATATKWATARTLTFTGSVTGSGTIDGSGNVSIAMTTNHSHSYDNYTGWNIKTSGNSTAYKVGANGTATFKGAGATTVTHDTSGNVTITSTNTTYGVVSKTANGLTPALPNETTTTKYLRQDGTWVVPPNTTYTHPTSSGNKHIPSGGASGQILRWSADGTAAWGSDNNTTYGVVSKTAAGLAPQLPNETTTTKYLRQDGTWVVPPDTNTVYTHPTSSGNKHIPSGGASGQILRWSADGTAVWGSDVDTNTWRPIQNVLTSTASDQSLSAAQGKVLKDLVDGKAAASHGNHVPTVQTASNSKFLRNDNTWQTVTPANIGAAASSHGNHVPTVQTANNAVFLRNDNTWQTVNPDSIGAARGGRVTGTTAATAQWYRIAQSGADIANCICKLFIKAEVSGKHSITEISSSITYGTGVSLQQEAHSAYSGTGISKVRMVYHGTYSGNRAYIEVYVPDATSRTIEVQMVGSIGWSLLSPSTVGSIPSGYSNKEITLVSGKKISDVQGTLSGNASTATTLQTTRSINGTNFNGSANITTANWGTARTITIGNSGKSVNGSGNVSWSLSEIGAVAPTGTIVAGRIATFNDTTGKVIKDSGYTIATSVPSGAKFTDTVYTHPTTSGNKHIPSGGSSGQILRWSADGTAVWSGDTNDTKVTNTLATTTKAYVTGTTSATTNTGTQVFDTGVYLDTTAGKLVASNFTGALSGNASTATTLQTTRSINGTNFNGSANITTANWGTARDIALEGAVTGVANINGSKNVSMATSLNSIKVPAGADLNNYTTPGLYYGDGSDIVNNANNHDSKFSLIVSKLGVDGTSQIIYDVDEGSLYVRHKVSSSSAWTRWDSTLMYSSPLEATKLSGAVPISKLPTGTTSSTVALGNHTHSYLPLSGGTITGNLTLSNPLWDSRLSGNTQLLNTNGAQIFVGNPATPLMLESSGDPSININGNIGTILHTGMSAAMQSIGDVNGNANDVTINSVSRNTGSTTNYPGSYGTLLTFNSNPVTGNYITQIYADISGSYLGYRMGADNSITSSWKRIITQDGGTLTGNLVVPRLSLSQDLIISNAGKGLYFDCPSRTSSALYWNANATNDYGMVLKVAGTTSLTASSNGVSVAGTLNVGNSNGNVRRTTTSTATPTGGVNGDVWIKY